MPAQTQSAAALAGIVDYGTGDDYSDVLAATSAPARRNASVDPQQPADDAPSATDSSGSGSDYEPPFFSDSGSDSDSEAEAEAESRESVPAAAAATWHPLAARAATNRHAAAVRNASACSVEQDVIDAVLAASLAEDDCGCGDAPPADAAVDIVSVLVDDDDHRSFVDAYVQRGERARADSVSSTSTFGADVEGDLPPDEWEDARASSADAVMLATALAASAPAPPKAPASSSAWRAAEPPDAWAGAGALVASAVASITASASSAAWGAATAPADSDDPGFASREWSLDETARRELQAALASSSPRWDVVEGAAAVPRGVATPYRAVEEREDVGMYESYSYVDKGAASMMSVDTVDCRFMHPRKVDMWAEFVAMSEFELGDGYWNSHRLRMVGTTGDGSCFYWAMSQFIDDARVRLAANPGHAVRAEVAPTHARFKTSQWGPLHAKAEVTTAVEMYGKSIFVFSMAEEGNGDLSATFNPHFSATAPGARDPRTPGARDQRGTPMFLLNLGQTHWTAMVPVDLSRDMLVADNHCHADMVSVPRHMLHTPVAPPRRPHDDPETIDGQHESDVVGILIRQFKAEIDLHADGPEKPGMYPQFRHVLDVETRVFEFISPNTFERRLHAATHEDESLMLPSEISALYPAGGATFAVAVDALDAILTATDTDVQ